VIVSKSGKTNNFLFIVINRLIVVDYKYKMSN
jgi:hypothetical protein